MLPSASVGFKHIHSTDRETQSSHQRRSSVAFASSGPRLIFSLPCPLRCSDTRYVVFIYFFIVSVAKSNSCDFQTEDKITKTILNWTGSQRRRCRVNPIGCISLHLAVKQNKGRRQNSSVRHWTIWILHQNCKWRTDWLSHLDSSQSPLVVSTVTHEQGHH